MMKNGFLCWSQHQGHFADFQEVVQDKVSKALVVFRNMQVTLIRAISVEREGKARARASADQ